MDLARTPTQDQAAHRLYMERENRRLREQIRQEQFKAEAFRTHAQRRLDAHDQHMGLNTRADDRVLEDASPSAGLLQSDDPAGQPPTYPIATPARSDAAWYYAVDGQTFGPVPSPALLQMLRTNSIPANVMVWTQGMADWSSADLVPALNSFVTS